MYFCNLHFKRVDTYFWMIFSEIIWSYIRALLVNITESFNWRQDFINFQYQSKNWNWSDIYGFMLSCVTRLYLHPKWTFIRFSIDGLILFSKVYSNPIKSLQLEWCEKILLLNNWTQIVWFWNIFKYITWQTIYESLQFINREDSVSVWNL